MRKIYLLFIILLGKLLGKFIANLLPPVLVHFTKYLSFQDQKSHTYLIGSIGVSGKTKWDVLDGVIRRLFKVRH